MKKIWKDPPLPSKGRVGSFPLKAAYGDPAQGPHGRGVPNGRRQAPIAWGPVPVARGLGEGLGMRKDLGSKVELHGFGSKQKGAG